MRQTNSLSINAVGLTPMLKESSSVSYLQRTEWNAFVRFPNRCVKHPGSLSIDLVRIRYLDWMPNSLAIISMNCLPFGGFNPVATCSGLSDGKKDGILFAITDFSDSGGPSKRMLYSSCASSICRDAGERACNDCSPLADRDQGKSSRAS